jgi:hypothetical protein
MITKKEFILHHIGDEHVIIQSGAGEVDFSHMITLNDTAAYLWENVEGMSFTTATLVDLLLEQYEVGEARALRDVKSMIADWKRVGIIEDEPSEEGLYLDV